MLQNEIKRAEKRLIIKILKEKGKEYKIELESIKEKERQQKEEVLTSHK